MPKLSSLQYFAGVPFPLFKRSKGFPPSEVFESPSLPPSQPARPIEAMAKKDNRIIFIGQPFRFCCGLLVRQTSPPVKTRRILGGLAHSGKLGNCLSWLLLAQ